MHYVIPGIYHVIPMLMFLEEIIGESRRISVEIATIATIAIIPTSQGFMKLVGVPSCLSITWGTKLLVEGYQWFIMLMKVLT